MIKLTLPLAYEKLYEFAFLTKILWKLIVSANPMSQLQAISNVGSHRGRRSTSIQYSKDSRGYLASTGLKSIKSIISWRFLTKLCHTDVPASFFSQIFIFQQIWWTFFSVFFQQFRGKYLLCNFVGNLALSFMYIKCLQKMWFRNIFR